MRDRIPSLRPGFCVVVVLLATLGCGDGPDTAPELSGLSLGMSYPDVASLAGGECDAIHDRGVRQLLWRYEDGSLVEATIHDGRLSGLEYDDGGEPRDRSVAAMRVRTSVQSDMSAPMLRELLGDHAVTYDDTSDRECLWSWSDGSLTAIFMRGGLERATWQPASDGPAQTLVAVDDPVPLLVRGLSSHRPSDRYRALHALEDADDSRIADALLELLGRETERGNRGRAVMLLARAGDVRAGDVLLRFLDERPLQREVIEALGMIGDARAEIRLEWTQENVEDAEMRREISRARRGIKRRTGRNASWERGR
ncbi:MAG: HEAT repeat domain-containing protein [bacterium]|nr:HEAT repeat domain-containing protein [bacterium]